MAMYKTTARDIADTIRGAQMDMYDVLIEALEGMPHDTTVREAVRLLRDLRNDLDARLVAALDQKAASL